MTIQECYKEMGGDFEGVQKRFGGVALVEKFAIPAFRIWRMD